MWVTVTRGSLSRVCHVQVKNWFRHIDLFAKEVWLIPVHISDCHWTLAVVDLRNGGRLGHLDSLSSATDAGTTIEILRRFIVDETEIRYKPPILAQEAQGWPTYEGEWPVLGKETAADRAAQQPNGW